MSEEKKSAFEIDHKQDQDLRGIEKKKKYTLMDFLMERETVVTSAALYNKETGDIVLKFDSPLETWRGRDSFITEEQRLIQRVYQTASRLDIVLADIMNGKEDVSLQGEEYEALMDTLIEAEDYMKRHDIKF